MSGAIGEFHLKGFEERKCGDKGHSLLKTVMAGQRDDASSCMLAFFISIFLMS